MEDVMRDIWLATVQILFAMLIGFAVFVPLSLLFTIFQNLYYNYVARRYIVNDKFYITNINYDFYNSIIFDKEEISAELRNIYDKNNKINYNLSKDLLVKVSECIVNNKVLTDIKYKEQADKKPLIIDFKCIEK